MIGRMRFVLAVMATVLLTFTGRLLWLQFARADALADASRANFLQERRITPLRGRILARDGTVLADVRVAYDLMYRGGEIDGWPRLARLLGLDPAVPPRPPDPTVREEARLGSVIAWNLPDASIPAVEEHVAGLEAVYLRERVERLYPTGLAAQTVGYTGLADPARHEGYAVDEMIGVTGLEAGLEPWLFGIPGRELVEVDNRGVEVAATTLLPATPGSDVVTTLEPHAQRAAEEALSGALAYVNAERRLYDLPEAEVVRGAFLVMDLESGDLLAMASAPSFDPNLFTHRPSDPRAVAAILNDARHQPLLNRTIEAYPPASTFKVLSSYVLLEEGYVRASDRFACTRSIVFGGITWRNWAQYDRGSYDAVQGIADSCNTYYWRAVLSTPDVDAGWGPFAEDLEEAAHAFGYGEPVGLPLPGERAGLVPNPDWTRSVKDTPWYPGYTLNTVIGQGDLLATPVQTMRFLGTLARSGSRVEPRLVRSIGAIEQDTDVTNVEGSSWPVLAEGMRHAVTDFGVSEFMGPSANFPLQVAGKTGTAQNGAGDHLEHTWFMGYVPADEPRLGIVVFLEYAGASGKTAVPVARDFFVDYFDLSTFEVERTASR